MKLAPEFYLNPDVVHVARSLLGKLLVTSIRGEMTSGRIVETEAYNGVVDRASHAYGGRRTGRTEVMFDPGGTAYVYLIYGMYHLFNVVTNVEGTPHAVLVRAVEPVDGLDIMLERRGVTQSERRLTAGPGVLSKALSITTALSGASLQDNTIWIEDREEKIAGSDIIASPRVGVDYAGEDAALDYRFRVKGSAWTSGK